MEKQVLNFREKRSKEKEMNNTVYTVKKAFGGLVIYRAIAGNISSYSREIYSQLKSLL